MEFIQKIDEMIEARDDSDGILTCGVELEFLVPSIDHKAEDPDPDITNQTLYRSTGYGPESIKMRIHRQLLNTLRSHLQSVPFRLMENDHYYPPHDNVVVYNSWRLGSDCTVHKHQKHDECPKGPYHWTDCELTSPVMGSYNYTTQIENVCQVLKAVRIHLNRSTSVHVHVGRGDNPFSLLTVKKFATLYWLTEKAIMDLHHPDRSNNSHCLALTQHSMLAARSHAILADEDLASNDGVLGVEAHVPEAGLDELRRAQIRRIWSCSSIEEVAELMWVQEYADLETPSTLRRGSIGFDRFLPAGKTGGNIQTFEWRQMSGSIDPKQINQWVKACIAFTDFCRLSNKFTFKEFVGNVIAKRGGYSGIELLEALFVDTHVFKCMQEEWARNRHFCNENQGSKLFSSY